MAAGSVLRATLAGFVLAVAAAAAAAGEGVADLDALFVEGRKWFLDAGDTERSIADRNAARVRAWKSLWPARGLLERLGEEKPDEAASLESKYGELRMMIYCLRKESPLGLLEKSGVGPAFDAGGGGAEGEEAGEEEPAAGPAPAPPPAAPPPPAPGAPAPPAPGAPAAEAPKAAPAGPPTVEALVAAAEEYEKRHRFDLPGHHARWLRVMTTHPDLSNPLVRKAVERAGALEARLKDAYRILRNEDPDALKGATNVRLKGLVFTVARDLSSPDAPLRLRAAKTLGLLSHPDGCYEIGKALAKEADAEVADALADALFRIGGAKGSETLADPKCQGPHAERALTALISLAKRNPVDRRIAAKALARFAGTREEEHFDRALRTLKSLGIDGVHGLAACTEVNTTVPRLLAVIQGLGESKEPSVARILAKYFQQGRTASDAQIRDAAMAAAKNLAQSGQGGEATIPHLFVGLRNVHTRAFTTQVLQEVTGQKFDVKHWNQWKSWWLSRHPDWKEGD